MLYPPATMENVSSLLDLPSDLVARVVSLCASVVDIARVGAACRLLHVSDSVAEALRMRARERGYEVPADGRRAARLLAAMLREASPRARAAAGADHSVFIDSEGRIASCGIEFVGQLGVLGHGPGHGGASQLVTPTRLPSLLGGERAVSLSAGDYHNLAITSDEALWSWGYGRPGQLGHGTHEDQLQPKKIEAFARQRVVAVSAGLDHNLAVTADGSVFSWGVGEDGRLGHGDEQPQLLPKRIVALSGLHVVAISAGNSHSLAVTAGGAVFSWGWGQAGKLGHGSHRSQLRPQRVTALEGQSVLSVSAGHSYSLAITVDGDVYSWGSGYLSQLGHGSEEVSLLPKKVEAFSGQRAVAVSAGDYHSLAITAGGDVYSWGKGNAGQLGHGNIGSQPLPRRIAALEGRRVVAVSAGSLHSLAFTAEPVGAWSWGASGSHLGHGYEMRLSRVTGQLSHQLLPMATPLL